MIKEGKMVSLQRRYNIMHKDRYDRCIVFTNYYWPKLQSFREHIFELVVLLVPCQSFVAQTWNY